MKNNKEIIKLNIEKEKIRDEINDVKSRFFSFLWFAFWLFSSLILSILNLDKSLELSEKIFYSILLFIFILLLFIFLNYKIVSFINRKKIDKINKINEKIINISNAE